MGTAIRDVFAAALLWWVAAAVLVVASAFVLGILVTRGPRAVFGFAAAVKRLRHRRPRVLEGAAVVTDADGLEVEGTAVRIAGLDAPEFDQIAKIAEGNDWINHGMLVKKALVGRIGGRPVRVDVEAWDRYGRALGTVTQDGRDIGEWLVRHGHAVAAYSDRYKEAERHAKTAGRGMWGYAKCFDPRFWRHRKEIRK